mgnify:CR=1 FL=1
MKVIKKYGVTWTELGIYHEQNFFNLDAAKVFAKWVDNECIIDVASLYILDDNDNIICKY